MQAAFVPKHRRPKFELTLRIIDLNNVPLVTGSAYVKWHLPLSTSAEHRGRTPKSTIKDHKCSWDYDKVIPVRLTVDKSGMLQELAIQFEILQVYSTGTRGDRNVLGNLKLNLAEYVDRVDNDGGEGITRRYLMQDSKINSTIKIGISMRQLEGEKNYVTPPLKTASVFGGIAGIIAGEQGEQDDIGHMPSVSMRSREIGELQDMYRTTLAASWAAQSGELPADECIENIFAGGTGWAPGFDIDGNNNHRRTQSDETTDSGSSPSDRERRRHRQSHTSAPYERIGVQSQSSPRKPPTSSPADTRSQPSLDSLDDDLDGNGERANGRSSLHEVSEFDVREDLRCWTIRPPRD